jgi:hypothetical protein
VCFVASGLTQPTIIRLSTSRRLRIRVSGKIPVVERTPVDAALREALIVDAAKALWKFVFTVSE